MQAASSAPVHRQAPPGYGDWYGGVKLPLQFGRPSVSSRMKLSRSGSASAGLLAMKAKLAAVGVPPLGVVAVILLRIWVDQFCNSVGTSLEVEISCAIAVVGLQIVVG